MEVPDITLLGRFRTPEDKFAFFAPKMGSKFSYPLIFRRQKRKPFKPTKKDEVSGYKIV